MKPILSIVVVIYNMRREIERTLHSLSIEYQRGIDKNDYEVLVIDNGSQQGLEADFFSRFKANTKYHYLKNAKSSPAEAMNFGAKNAEGQYLGLMIDGARLLTPGILAKAKNILLANKMATVTVLGWHLGPKLQKDSVLDGYNQEVEDKLLKKIDWPNDGYGLFDIATRAGSNMDGWQGQIAESNCFFVNKKKYEELGGLNEKFVTPGGGIVNLDFYKRAVESPDGKNFGLIDEGTFHQIHSQAISSNTSIQKNNPFQDYLVEYKKIYGCDYVVPTVKYEYY